jgi:hypothetical protein
VQHSRLVSTSKTNKATINEDIGKTVKDNGKKILVVDNEIDITLLIEEGLEQRGFYIKSYNDPQLPCESSNLVFTILC